MVPAKGFSQPTSGPPAAQQAFTNSIAFCRVAATVTPSSDSDIKIEVWMPVSGWNAKFQAVGNGGWAGAISYPAMSEALARGLAMHQVLWRTPSSVVPETKYRMIHEAVLDACDAIDGLKDRLIQDPTRCRFDPDVLVCKREDAPTCLTRPQAEAVATLMSPVTTRSGVEILPRREPGSELGWGFLFARPDPPPLVADTFRYLLYKDPKWDWRTFDLDRDVEKAEASPEIRSADAIDPDLQPFVRRRGKLLMYSTCPADWRELTRSGVAAVIPSVFRRCTPRDTEWSRPDSR